MSQYEYPAFLSFLINRYVLNLFLDKVGLVDQNALVLHCSEVLAAESSLIELKLSQFISLFDLYLRLVVFVSSVDHVVGRKPQYSIKFTTLSFPKNRKNTQGSAGLCSYPSSCIMNFLMWMNHEEGPSVSP